MAITASSVLQESMGSLTLRIVKFASVATAGEIYNSGVVGIVGVWANMTTGTAIGNGVSAGVTTAGTTGAILVMPDTAGSVTLYIASKSG